MWTRLATFLLVGYLCWGRSFAYLGMPPVHLFIGEAALLAFIFLGPRAGKDRWMWVALRQEDVRSYRIAFSVLFGLGVCQVVRGILIGHPAILAIRDLAVNYYPLYFLLGVWAGLQREDFLPKALRIAAWINGIYGVLYILVLSRIGAFYPGVAKEADPVPLFGEPLSSFVILLGLLCFEKSLKRVLPLLVLNGFVILGQVIRAEWLAFLLGVAIWAKLTKKVKRLALGVAVVVGIIAVMYVTDFSYDAPEGRGGTISAKAIVGRIIAPVNPDLAADYTDEAALHEGTAVWRTVFWYTIWSAVHENKVSTLFGFGYGYPLNDFVPYFENEATRTPHNVFFLELGYTGWIGVLIFACFQYQLVRLLLRVYKITGQPFGLVFWAAALGFALFTPYFEVPQGAIPFFLITGCACGPLFAPSRSENLVPAIAGNPAEAPLRTLTIPPS